MGMLSLPPALGVAPVCPGQGLLTPDQAHK